MNFSLRIALAVSSILIALGYILAQLHLADPIQIQTIPLKMPPQPLNSEESSSFEAPSYPVYYSEISVK